MRARSAFVLATFIAGTTTAQTLSTAPNDPSPAPAAATTEQTPPAQERWFFPFAIVVADEVLGDLTATPTRLEFSVIYKFFGR